MNRKILFVGLVMMIMMAGAAMGQNDCYNPTMRAAKAAYDKGNYRQAEKYYREAADCYDCTAQQKAQARKQATECRKKIEADEAAKRRRQEEARQAEERRREEAEAAERKRKEEARLAKERRQREEELRQREEELNRREEQQRQREAALRREEEQAAERKRQEEARQAEERRKREEAERNRKRDDITLNVSGVEFTMVWVEGGTFTMGCTSEQGDDCQDREKPDHSVTLSNYYIGETEVTVGLFRQFISQTGYKTDAEKYGWAWACTNKSGGWKWDTLYNVSWMCDTKGSVRNITQDNHPVMYVSWNDATEFCKWLSRQTGRTFRLPTEAEWEYAARGGRKSKGYKYSGGDNIGEVAWYGYSNNAGGDTPAVKGKKANELGLYNMSGNVWEWCSDRWGSYSSSSQRDPAGPTTGSYRVLRGGSWGNTAKCCRVSYRTDYRPDEHYSHFGFRLVLCP